MKRAIRISVNQDVYTKKSSVAEQFCLVPPHIRREELARELDMFLDVIVCEPSNSSIAST
jgi:hypothetical protein